MAAGLGFKDFVTGEVLTAADVDGYLMQNIWVFASAAARDAAVTSPQEGNFAYLKDTNVTTYYTGSAWANLDTTGMTNPMTTTGDTIYSSSGSTPARLGIGTTGQVLTVAGGIPSWATAAGGSRGLNQVIPTSVAVGSGTATVGTNGMVTFTTAGTNLSINGCFTSTYTNYLIVMDTDFSSSYDFPSIRMRASGTDNTTASSYIYQRQTVSDTTVAGSRLTANRWQDAFAIDDSKTNGIELTFYRPFEADSTAIATANEVFALSGAYIWRGCGTHNQNTSYDGFSIILGAGTITGKLRVYGWQE